MREQRNNVLFSIIIPFKEVEERLISTVQKLLSDIDSRCEVILIENADIDSLVGNGWLGELRDQVRYFQIDSHDSRGAQKARNLGLQKAVGCYVSFLDSDDIIDKHFVRNRLEGIVSLYGRTSIVFTGRSEAWNNSGKVSEVRKYGLKTDDYFTHIIEGNYDFGVWNVAFRRDSLDVSPWDEKLYIFQDYDLLVNYYKFNESPAYASDILEDYVYVMDIDKRSISSGNLSKNKIESSVYLILKTSKILRSSELGVMRIFIFRFYERLVFGNSREELKSALFKLSSDNPVEKFGVNLIKQLVDLWFVTGRAGKVLTYFGFYLLTGNRRYRQLILRFGSGPKYNGLLRR